MPFILAQPRTNPAATMKAQDDRILNTEMDPFLLDSTDVVEVPLLLSGWQMSALEQAAFLRGLTAAEMVRQLLREVIGERPAPC